MVTDSEMIEERIPVSRVTNEELLAIGKESVRRSQMLGHIQTDIGPLTYFKIEGETLVWRHPKSVLSGHSSCTCDLPHSDHNAEPNQMEALAHES